MAAFASRYARAFADVVASAHLDSSAIDRLLNDFLLGAALVLVSLASLFVPGQWIRTPAVTIARLVLPCLAVWLTIQFQLLGRRQLSDERPQPADRV